MNSISARLYKQCFLILLLAMLAAASFSIRAESGAKHLTVHGLESDGYQLLKGQQLHNIFKLQGIEVTDIESGAIRIFHPDHVHTDRMESVSKVKDAKSSAMFDPDLVSRPAPLVNARYKITGDAIIATDGVREYRLSFYRKGDSIYAVRNVDAGKVYFLVRPLAK